MPKFMILLKTKLRILDSARRLLLAGFLLDLIFDPEGGSSMLETLTFTGQHGVRSQKRAHITETSLHKTRVPTARFTSLEVQY
jgi:hypothetical protein